MAAEAKALLKVVLEGVKTEVAATEATALTGAEATAFCCVSLVLTEASQDMERGQLCEAGAGKNAPLTPQMEPLYNGHLRLFLQRLGAGIAGARRPGRNRDTPSRAGAGQATY